MPLVLFRSTVFPIQKLLFSLFSKIAFGLRSLQNCRLLFPSSFELNNVLSKSQNPWEVIIPKVEDKGPANVRKWKKWQMCVMVSSIFSHFDLSQGVF